MTPHGSIETTASSPVLANSASPAHAGFIAATLAIAGKDLRTELRTKETVNAALAFALVILLLFSFAFDPSPDLTQEIAGGLLWLVYAFAGALILNRSFARELGNDCLDALLSSPVSGPELYLGKCISNFVLLMTVEIMSLPVFTIFYTSRWMSQWPMLLGVMMLGTWGMTAIGTMFSAMTVNLRLRELMLPILVYPMMIPALMAAIQLTGLIMAGEPIAGDNLLWVRVLVVFDVLFSLLAFALVEVVLIG